MLLALFMLIASTPPARASGSLELIPQPSLLIFLIVLFAILILPVNSLIFKPIFAALDERENRIAGARRRAGQIEHTASEVLRRYESSIREARAGAEATRRQQVAEARAEQTAIARAARDAAERRLEQARGELRDTLVEARSGLREQTQALATASAEQVLGRNLR